MTDPVTAPLAPAVFDVVRGQLTKRIAEIVSAIENAVDGTLTMVLLAPHDGQSVIRLPEYHDADVPESDAAFHARGGRVLWRRAITPTVPPPGMRGQAVREQLAACATMPPSAFAAFTVREVNQHGGYDGGLELTLDVPGLLVLLASADGLPRRYVVKGVDTRGREWWLDPDDFRSWCVRL